MDDTFAASLLRITLQAAVPLWIDQLKQEPWETLQDRAQVCGEVIAHHGDNILFKSKKVGESSEALNRLAEALAVLSYCPGGVTFLGDHWEANKMDI